MIDLRDLVNLSLRGDVSRRLDDTHEICDFSVNEKGYVRTEISRSDK